MAKRVPWNKGLKKGMPGAQTNYNTEGFKLGWTRVQSEEERKATSERMRKNNPNHGGKVNKLRSKYRVKNKAFDTYRYECVKYTRRTERSISIPEERGKYKECLQLDHIIPFKQGFELGIDPQVMGSEHNIQWITQEENRQKWDKWVPQETVDGILRSCNRSLRESP